MVAASASLHNSMLERVLQAPMAFFDSTPLGRIMNRFSRDIETLDNQLPQIMFMLITCVFSVAATIVVICVDTPWFAAVLLPLFLAYLAVQVSLGQGGGERGGGRKGGWSLYKTNHILLKGFTTGVREMVF